MPNRVMIAASLGTLILLAAWSQGQDSQQGEGWACPVPKATGVMQGNFGSVSHFDIKNKYAFDYSLPEGSPVVAARSGTVSDVSLLSVVGGGDESLAQFGNLVKLEHQDGTQSVYMHLQHQKPIVRIGEFVQRGELIGYSGSTGYCRSAHLHFAVLNDGASLRIRFIDFTKHDGIPEEGDRHGPADPPAIPQNFVDLVKPLYRAASRAESLNWPEIGLTILSDLPRGEHDDYFYCTKAYALETRLKGLLCPEESSTDVPEEFLLRLTRMCECLAEVPGVETELAKLRSELDALEIEDQPGRKKIESVMPEVITAMKFECHQDFDEAIKCYSKAFRRASGQLQEFIQSRLDSIAASVKDDWVVHAMQRQREAEHERAIKSEVKKAAAADYKRIKSLINGLKKAMPRHEPFKELSEQVDQEYSVILRAL